VTDNVHRPSRKFCNSTLVATALKFSYFDPLIGAVVRIQFKPNALRIGLENIDDLEVGLDRGFAALLSCRSRAQQPARAFPRIVQKGCSGR